MEKEYLINDILKYMNEYDYYNFRDNYATDEEAYITIDAMLENESNKTQDFFIDEINSILKYEDLQSSYYKKQLDCAYNIAVKVNEYINISKKINMDLET